MTCQVAHSFPPFAASFLERGLKLNRQFREETITEMLMASLVPFVGPHLRILFPSEIKTGADMEWIFTAPNEPNGGRQLTVRIQAKRAYFQDTKTGGYWYYRHLDHKKGAQAQTLIAAAKKPDTFAYYAFYHPTSAVSFHSGAPAIEGVNLHEAVPIARTVHRGKIARADKKVSRWQPGLFPLSRLLCGAQILSLPAAPNAPVVFYSTVGGLTAALSEHLHPDIIARRLNALRTTGREATGEAMDQRPVEPRDGISRDVRRAIAGEASDEDLRRLERPRIIFSTSLQRSDEMFENILED